MKNKTAVPSFIHNKILQRRLIAILIAYTVFILIMWIIYRANC